MIRKNQINKISPHPALTDLPPLAMDEEALKHDFLRYFNRTLGRDHAHCTNHYLYEALALTVRDRLMERWKCSRITYEKKNARRTCYLSLEFLMGRALGNALINLGIDDAATRMLNSYAIAMEEVADAESDAGLGNGGLGRLAACFLDSCATLQLPVLGYGLRYEYGMFRQKIENGFQKEDPDHWLRDGNPWELERPEFTQRIQFGGHTEHFIDLQGKPHVRWAATNDVLAVPYDIPVPGYNNDTVNSLRLWKSTATDEFDLDDFNAGDYSEAVAAKNSAEHITMVLYPNDSSENGKELRLRQQYFLASASLKDVVRRWISLNGKDFSQFSAKHCFQLNDTHPSIAVAELMRILLDEERLEWDAAWQHVNRSMAYTNHTLLPEALEKWSVPLFRTLLPRLLEIILEINARFLAEVAQRWPWDSGRLSRMSIIEEGDTQMVRMAYLAIVGSFSVNGVAELHSQLLREGLFADFYELWPEKFNNKTNGVTQRRWLALCNPGLNTLLNDKIGKAWITNLSELTKIAAYADDPAFHQQWRQIKSENKQRLADLIARECSIEVSTEALFDVQVKRIHEYKRQLLNVLHGIHLYNRLKHGDTANWTNRCIIIGGKAAPGYFMAKLIIKLINNVAYMINHDKTIGDRLKMVFLPNYRVSMMEVIAPGSDLSEQISTAGKEASGTGNMKFMMNGAITIGTYDGANIEILEEVGKENFFLFGLNAQEVNAARHHYQPWEIINADAALREVIGLIENNHFSQLEPGLFQPIIDAVRSAADPWLTAADFRSYIDAQQRVADAYRNQKGWTRMSILNTAHSGKFSTDRTMEEYNRDIWKLDKVEPIKGTCKRS
ncbi:MAG: glycogen/starch/alpha-glucan phosphorylase [Gammaproteobacteria bacterium]|nr:glycogen/starch/alpha-glucan phosphorylase [Gammaproteobacteria bacterium]